MKNDRVRKFVWLDTRSPDRIANYDHILADEKMAKIQNSETEKRIRLTWDVPNLEIKLKNIKMEIKNKLSSYMIKKKRFIRNMWKGLWRMERRKSKEIIFKVYER